jgi:hypothetical protein
MKTVLTIVSLGLAAMGLVDLAEQIKAGEELRWTVPILLIGVGAGLPIILFSIPEPPAPEDASYLASAQNASFDDSGGTDDANT